MSTDDDGSMDANEFFDKVLSLPPITFGSMLENIRECEEWTQAEMGERLGISASHICDIEKGRKSASAARAAEFARKLGYSEEYFVQCALQQQIDLAGLELRVKIEAG